eukprot:2396790-Pyramimonas_sp.AAC.1
MQASADVGVPSYSLVAARWWCAGTLRRHAGRSSMSRLCNKRRRGSSDSSRNSRSWTADVIV